MTGEKLMPTIKESSEALNDIVGVLQDFEIPFFLDGGTLLGFYRDGKFAEDDHDDIDITIPAIFWENEQEINKDMMALGFELYHSWPRNKREHYSGQYAWKRGNVKVDLMFKEVKKDIIWWTIYGGKRGVTYKAVPRYLFSTPKIMEIVLGEIGKTLQVGIPEKVEEYLEYRYGDWKTPVHRSKYSCYKTDKCIVENYEAI